MPYSELVQDVIAWPLQVNVPLPDGSNATIQIYDDGNHPEGWADDLLQDLVDYMQGWPGRLVGGDATGIRYLTQLKTMLTTNPDPQG